MPTVPAGLVYLDQLEKEIAKAKRRLGKYVVSVKHRFTTDSTGEPCIYFHIVLTDAASREDKLMDTTRRVEAIFGQIRAYENWGFLTYFRYRSRSEADKLTDPEW